MGKSSDAYSEALQKIVGGGLIWFAVAFFVVIVALFNTVKMERITGEHVGVMLNKLNGDIEVIEKSGTKVYNGITKKLYILDKTIQTLEMTSEVGRGERREKDDLKIKTVDGSDVYVDLKVQFKLKPAMADVVISSSGPGDNFKHKWARDYVRSLTRDYLGELTTEEFYDSAKRDVQIILALHESRKRLDPFGIHIDRIVIPKKPTFYKEYEEMIKSKKLADQEVLEQRSKALAAKQKQQTMVIQETNKNNVTIEQFEGQMKQLVIEATANADKTIKEADSYFDRVTIGAGATLYKLTKEADGILTLKKAEAKGIEALNKALEGGGGRNMVKMEYAKKLKGITITGKPFTIQTEIARFEHLKSAATTGRE